MSDSRLKENLTIINDSLNVLRSVDVYNFTWKETLTAAIVPRMRDLAGKADIGFLVQSLSAVWPYSIGEKIEMIPGEEAYYQFNPTQMIPLVMASIKELDTVVNQLSSL
jgi:hypothetical protein